VNSLTKVLARPNAVEEWRDSDPGSYLTSAKLRMTPFTFKTTEVAGDTVSCISVSIIRESSSVSGSGKCEIQMRCGRVGDVKMSSMRVCLSSRSRKLSSCW
jgi:hypothetical protein